MCLCFNAARLFFKVKFSLFPDFVTPKSRNQIFYLKTKRNCKKTKFNQRNRTDWRFETQGRVDSETCAHIRKNPSYSLVKTGFIKAPSFQFRLIAITFIKYSSIVDFITLVYVDIKKVINNFMSTYKLQKFAF